MPDLADPAHHRRQVREIQRMADALGYGQDLYLLRHHLARLAAGDRSPLGLRVELRKALAGTTRTTARRAG